MTHQGPGDVAILHSLPGMQIVVPGTAAEFDRLFRQACANGSATYYRLSTSTNPATSDVDFGKLTVIKKGSEKSATLIAVGPTLGNALAAVQDLDVTVLYCTTIAPFDGETLREVASGSDIILVEPYYQGVLVPDIMEAMSHRPVRVKTIGVPHRLLTHYGTPEEHDAAIGLTSEAMREHIKEFLKI